MEIYTAENVSTNLTGKIIATVNASGYNTGSDEATLTIYTAGTQLKKLRVVLDLNKTVIYAGETLSITVTVYDETTNVTVEGANVTVELSDLTAGKINRNTAITKANGKATFIYTTYQNITEDKTINITVKVIKSGYIDSVVRDQWSVLKSPEKPVEIPGFEGVVILLILGIIVFTALSRIR